MSSEVIGIIGTAALGVLLLVGMKIGFAAALVGFIGLSAIVGVGPAISFVGTSPFSTVSKYALSVLPLFMLMGYVAYDAGITTDLFKIARQWVGHVPGGLLSASVLTGAGFGAVCGASVASAAVLSQVCLPELERYNYDRKISVGCLAASSTLAAFIPPSTIMVVYGIMTEQSVGKLLIGGIFPGLLTAASFIVMITFRVWRNPSLGKPMLKEKWKERLNGLKGSWSLLLLAGLVTGGIYTGIFTPTEAGAAGTGGALLIAAARRRLPRAALMRTLLETGRIVCAVFIIIVGILIFTTFIAHSKLTYTLGQALVALPWPPLAIFASILVCYLFLGMFLDSLGMLILTLPFVFPTLQAFGFDPIWSGLVVIYVVEVGLITPPVGLNVFVVRAAAPHIPLTDIFRGTLSFVLCNLIVAVLMIAFPQICLLLPNTMVR